MWSYLNQPDILEKFTNPLYEPNAGIIWPSVAPVSIDLWRELYFGHNGAAPWDGMLPCIINLKERQMEVKRTAAELHQQIKVALNETDLLVLERKRDSGDDTKVREDLGMAQLSLEQAQST